MTPEAQRAGLLDALKDKARSAEAAEIWRDLYEEEPPSVAPPPTRGPIPDPAAAVAARREGGGSNWLKGLSRASDAIEGFVDGPLKAGAARFNDDVTFGIYPAVIDALGLDTRERRAALAAKHPIADTVGSGAAFGATLMTPWAPAAVVDRAVAQAAVPVVTRAANPIVKALTTTAANATSGAVSGGLQSLARGESPIEGAKHGAAGGVVGTVVGGGVKKIGDVVENASPYVADYVKAKAAGLFDLPILKNLEKVEGGLGSRKMAESALRSVAARDAEIIANQKALQAEDQAPFLETELVGRDKAQAGIRARAAENTDPRDDTPLDPVLAKALQRASKFLGETPPAPIVRPPAVPEMVQENLRIPGRAPIDTRQPGYPPLPGPLRDPQNDLPFSPFRKDWKQVSSGAEIGAPGPPARAMVQENLQLSPEPQMSMRFPRGQGAPPPSPARSSEPPDPFAPALPVRSSPEAIQEGLPIPGRSPSGEYLPGYPGIDGPARDPQVDLPFPARDRWDPTMGGPPLPPPPQINPPPTLRTANAKLKALRDTAGFDNRGQPTKSQMAARAEYAALKSAIDASIPDAVPTRSTPSSRLVHGDAGLPETISDAGNTPKLSLREIRAAAAADAAAGRRRSDIVFRSEQPVGGPSATSKPIDAVDDEIAGISDELGPVDQPMRVAKENQGAKFLGRAGDRNIPGDDAATHLEELAAMDPEFAFQLELVKAKKAQEAVRFSLESLVPGNLPGTNEGMGLGKAIRQQSRFLGSKVLGPTLRTPEALRDLGLPTEFVNPLSLPTLGENLQRAGARGFLTDPLDAIRQWYANTTDEREKARAALASPVNTVRDWYRK